MVRDAINPGRTRAETALGNPDPEGGSDADPKTYDETGRKGTEA